MKCFPVLYLEHPMNFTECSRCKIIHYKTGVSHLSKYSIKKISEFSQKFLSKEFFNLFCFCRTLRAMNEIRVKSVQNNKIAINDTSMESCSPWTSGLKEEKESRFCRRQRSFPLVFLRFGHECVMGNCLHVCRKNYSKKSSFDKER